MPTIWVIIIYLGGLLAFAMGSKLFFRGTSADYFVASRSIGPFMLLMSVFGTTMTASEGEPETVLQEAAGWGVHRADISDFAGKTVRLRFHVDSDSFNVYAGLAIDDVSVIAYAAMPEIVVAVPLAA